MQTIEYKTLPNGRVVVPKELLKKWHQAYLCLSKLYGQNYFTNGFKSGELIACITPSIIQRYVQGMSARHAVGMVRYSPTEPGIILWKWHGDEHAYLTFTNDGEVPSSTFKAKLLVPAGFVVDLDRLNALPWDKEKFNLFKQVVDLRAKAQATSNYQTPRETKEKREYNSARWDVREAIRKYRYSQPIYRSCKQQLFSYLEQNKETTARIVRVLKKRYGLDIEDEHIDHYYDYTNRHYKIIRSVFTKPHHHVKTVHFYAKNPQATGCTWEHILEYSPWLRFCVKRFNLIARWKNVVNDYTCWTLQRIAECWKEYRLTSANHHLRIHMDAKKVATKQALMKKRAIKAGNLMESAEFDKAVDELKSLIWDVKDKRYLTQRVKIDGTVEPEPKSVKEPQPTEQSVKEEAMTYDGKEIAMDGEVLALVGDVVVTRTSYKGKEKIDVRKVYENGDDKLHPTRQGIRLTSEQWAHIVDAIKAAVAA